MDLFAFIKPKNELEGSDEKTENQPFVPDEMWVKCPSCGTMLLSTDVEENDHVCFKCNYHFRLNGRQRIELLADKGTFEEMDSDLESRNIIDFPDYDKKLLKSKMSSGEKESVICGVCNIGNIRTVLVCMNPDFMMGSMGTVTGEKVTRAFEYAT